MSTISKIFYTTICISGLPIVSQAASFNFDPHPYVGVNVSRQHISESDGEPNLNLGVAKLQLGVNFNPYIALEARAGRSFKQSNILIDGRDTEFKIKHQYAAYLKLMLPNRYIIKPYALVGGSWSRYKATSGGFFGYSNENKFSWGIGAQVKTSRHTFVTLEYVNQGKDNGAKFSSVGLSANYLF